MRNYATLFDKSYMAKGLAMYESLAKHSSADFRMSILAMDEDTEITLEELKLPKTITITRGLMEPIQQLSNAKLDRSWPEYCYTCASQLLEFTLGHFDLEEMTYLDADLFFFSDPEPVFSEIAERSIGIIPHRFIPSKQHLEVNGKFNVGMVHFKATPIGRECLETWASQVRKKCDASTCGDQVYLDEWPGKYGDEVCIVENIGANVAPWNVGNYAVAEGPAVDGLPIIFYHFHETKENEDGTYRLTMYDLRNEDRHFIYQPYLAALDSAKAQIKTVLSGNVDRAGDKEH